jgi:glycosyltransferase involved in cell wall biosynthesis
MPSFRVSVVITSYNQEAYLAEAIESAIQQSSRPHEIIIADDHSTRDNSVKLIRQYEQRYAGWIRAVIHPSNVGIPRNRNSGLEIVTGDHVVVLDGDDRLLPEFIARLTTALIENPETQCAYSNRYQMDSAGQRVRPRDTEPQPSGDLFAHIAAGRVGILRSLVAPCQLIRRAGMFDPKFFHQDGYVLTLRLATMAKFIYVPEPLMEKRMHPGGTSKTISVNERIQCFEDIAAEVARLATRLSRTEEQRINRIWAERIAKLRRQKS